MKTVLSSLDTYIGRKKLVALFGAIIIVGITILYFENIYSITHRSKTLLEESFNTKTSDKTVPNTSTDLLEKSIENNVLNDNKNNDNLTKCWNTEKFTLIEECRKCDVISRNSLYACKKTGYREVLNCEKYGVVSRSCPVPDHVQVKHYWTFEIVSLILTAIFTTVVQRRKKFLDQIATERVRRQILSS